MSLFGPTVPDRIRTSFRFLLETGRYRIIAESEGMGGAITYRSPQLWIAAEWDRSLPWLEFSPTHHSLGRFDWILVGLLLNDADYYEPNAETLEVAEPEALADWLRPRLADIEARFSDPLLPETTARLTAYSQKRARVREAYWRERERQYRERNSSTRLPNNHKD